MEKSKADNSNRIRVGLIFGGQSFEHEVSKMTAESIKDHIDQELFDVIDIYIDKKGKFDKSLLKQIDIAFLAVHGPNCEDGKLQNYLEKRKIRYTGSDIKASKINMDKVKMHQVFQKNGLSTVNFLAVSLKSTHLKSVDEKIAKSFGYPCYVKPNNTGSSFGIRLVKNIDELKKSLALAFKFDNSVIIEQAVKKPREIEVGILGNSKLLVTEPGEILTDGEFFSYNLKYHKNLIKLVAEDLTPEQINNIKNMAKKAYQFTGCSGYARIDFFIDENGKILINEINTLPGCTKNSIFPKMMETKGIPFKDLISKIIKLAM